ncbi:MAG: cytochrome P460 family protein [Sneathiella sp.]
MIQTFRRRMISTTALALVLSLGVTDTYSGTMVRALWPCQPSQPIRVAAASCKANPCAVKKTRNLCNPCAVKKTCNPCAAKKACNPCNATSVATHCVVPRLVMAYKGRNPCAIKKIGSPCNPCAVKKTSSPCNPSAVKKTSSPCNPCAASAKPPPELADAEAVAAYTCVGPSLAQAYGKSDHPVAVGYRKWTRFSKIAYPADAHGTRFMNNYANEVAAADYGKWEAAGTMPKGSVLAKDSFIVADDGHIFVGPLFIMEKGVAGSNSATRDWQYTMIMPGGIVRRDTVLQKFCNGCHYKAGAEDDNLMFLPLPFRISKSSAN